MSLFSRLFPKDEDDPSASDADGTVLVSPEDVTSEAALPSGYVSSRADQTDPVTLGVPLDPAALVPTPPPVPRPSPARALPRPRPVTQEIPPSAVIERVPTLPPPRPRTPALAGVPREPANGSGSGARRPPEWRPAPRTAADTAADLAALHATFEDLAIDHVRPVRTLMVELRAGEAPASWIDLARPALRSLRSMAGQVELPALCVALDGFAAALDEAARRPEPSLGGRTRDELLAAYAPLALALPRAFALEGEDNRRETLIVQGLLERVPSLDPATVERLCAVGLARLDALLAANVDDLMAVAGLPRQTAVAVVAAAQQLRHDRQAPPAPPRRLAGDTAALGPLLATLDTQHRAYEQAAQGWSEESVAAKRRLRRERTGTWLQISALLVRLGAQDLLERLEPYPFARKIAELGRFLRKPEETAWPS